MNKKLKKEFEEKFTWLNKENTEEGVRLLSISKSDKLWTWINENFSLKSQTAKAVGVETDVMPNEVIAGGSLLTTLKINNEPIESTPIEVLKILVASLPNRKHDGSDREDHWNIIEKWLDELLQKASQREA